MRTQKLELEARVQAAEDARRQIADQLNEMMSKHQRSLAKQVVFVFDFTFHLHVIRKRGVEIRNLALLLLQTNLRRCPNFQ